MTGKVKVDEFITSKMMLEQINDAFEFMHHQVGRKYVKYWYSYLKNARNSYLNFQHQITPNKDTMLEYIKIQVLISHHFLRH